MWAEEYLIFLSAIWISKEFLGIFIEGLIWIPPFDITGKKNLWFKKILNEEFLVVSQ